LSTWNLATVLRDLGRLADSEKLFREIHRLRTERFGPDYRTVYYAEVAIGRVLLAQGRIDEAEDIFRRALEGHRQTVGNEHKSTFKAIEGLVIALIRNRSVTDEAQALAEELVQYARRKLSIGDFRRFDAERNLAWILIRRGKLVESTTHLQGAIETYLGHDSAMVRTLRELLCRTYIYQDELEKAAAIVNSMRGSDTSGSQEEDASVAAAMLLDGRIRTRNGDLDAAVELLRRGLDATRSHLGKVAVAEAELDLGIATGLQSKYAVAEPLLHSAHKAFVENLGNHDWQTIQCAERLVDYYDRRGMTEQAQRFREAASGEAAPLP